MIQTQWALIQRELWEHRAIYVVPIVVGILISLSSITGQVAVSTSDQAIDIALLGAANLSPNERAAAISVFLIVLSSIFVMVMGVLGVFYALDALYSERKDKSILFWRSLPVTDAETVISKLLTALVVIPVITFAMIAVTHLVVLTISSVWVGVRGANAGSLIWQAVPLLDNWTATFIVIIAGAIWVSPFAGWFLFVSAFTKRSPFLTALLPIIVIPMLEKIVLSSSFFLEMLLSRAPFGGPIVDFSAYGYMFDSDAELLSQVGSGVSLMSIIDVTGFVTSIDVWIGVVVCGLFCTAAIYVRRYRDES